jgi:hypothetical protein
VVKARQAARSPAHPVAPSHLGNAGLGELPGREALTRTLKLTAQRRPVPPRRPRRGRRARCLRRLLLLKRRRSRPTMATCVSPHLHRSWLSGGRFSRHRPQLFGGKKVRVRPSLMRSGHRTSCPRQSCARRPGENPRLAKANLSRLAMVQHPGTRQSSLLLVLLQSSLTEAARKPSLRTRGRHPISSRLAAQTANRLT